MQHTLKLFAEITTLLATVLRDIHLGKQRDAERSECFERLPVPALFGRVKLKAKMMKNAESVSTIPRAHRRCLSGT